MYSPVRYCRNQPVQVHSGLPRRRGYMQSRWMVLPGRTAITPDGSYDADPTPTLIRMDGGLSSKNKQTENTNKVQNQSITKYFN